MTVNEADLIKPKSHMTGIDSYLIIDIGTGNARVAVVQSDGTVTGVARDDIRYHRDELYPESIFFRPDELWTQIETMASSALQQAGAVNIRAFVTTSQREGIVLIGKDGSSLIGLPNIDHRGREWEPLMQDKSRVYELTGRYPTSLFSALKLVGIRERRKEIWDRVQTFLSISDWVEYKLTGLCSYEHSQASETLLYDVERKDWSDELLEVFNLDRSLLPEIRLSGSISGKIMQVIASGWNVSEYAVVIKGGGDTQLAIRSTQPGLDDVVIVSGTTTPIVKLVDRYITDRQQRTWTSRDITDGRFIFEANAGVTGLNYQRLKEVFYPNEGYEVIEQELQRHLADGEAGVVASLGSLIATEKTPVIRGGFVFSTPVSHELTRSSFVWATLVDIAFSIAENYQVLNEVAGHDKPRLWACGGGLQSRVLRQLIANITGKEVCVRTGFEQASAVGGALLCNATLGVENVGMNESIETAAPVQQTKLKDMYRLWKNTREQFRKTGA